MPMTPPAVLGVSTSPSKRFTRRVAGLSLVPQSAEGAGGPQNPALHRNRLPSGKLYRWEFEKREREVNVDVPGALTLDHIGLMVEAAADGLGIAYVPERSAKPYLDDGRLVTVLEDWCPRPSLQCAMLWSRPDDT